MHAPLAAAQRRAWTSVVRGAAPPRSQSRSRGPESTDSFGASTDAGDLSSSSSPAASLDADPDAIAAAAAEAARTAYLDGTLGVGFSAGGLLFPYYCGVSAELIESNVIRDHTPIAGASAGSLIAACTRSGLTMGEVLDACYAMCDDLRAKGTRFRLGPVLEGVLRETLPETAAAAASGRAHVAVTAILPEPRGPPLLPRLVAAFEDKDDLIAALMTSCHIPIYFDGRLATRFRGGFAFDGGLTDFLPSPPGADYTVRVCCFPSSQLSALGRVDIAPDASSYTMRQLLAWAFEPAEKGVLEELVARGRDDARAWAEASGVRALAAAAAGQAAGRVSVGATMGRETSSGGGGGGIVLPP